ncbi:hypothetical protein J1605_010379 [Eschrichtius robustus]|uniref:Uncharacterized protein n=1 Tax=Eschrichtius robustus TaxID=9764 RepID=A0AB34GSP9_ESCRO|nr:hypothetical protein J1605_010379 [Eschrichtius robustus]
MTVTIISESNCPGLDCVIQGCAGALTPGTRNFARGPLHVGRELPCSPWDSGLVLLQLLGAVGGARTPGPTGAAAGTRALPLLRKAREEAEAEGRLFLILSQIGGDGQGAVRTPKGRGWHQSECSSDFRGCRIHSLACVPTWGARRWAGGIPGTPGTPCWLETAALRSRGEPLTPAERLLLQASRPEVAGCGTASWGPHSPAIGTGSRRPGSGTSGPGRGRRLAGEEWEVCPWSPRQAPRVLSIGVVAPEPRGPSSLLGTSASHPAKWGLEVGALSSSWWPRGTHPRPVARDRRTWEEFLQMGSVTVRPSQSEAPPTGRSRVCSSAQKVQSSAQASARGLLAANPPLPPELTGHPTRWTDVELQAARGGGQMDDRCGRRPPRVPGRPAVGGASCNPGGRAAAT